MKQRIKLNRRTCIIKPMFSSSSSVLPSAFDQSSRRFFHFLFRSRSEQRHPHRRMHLFCQIRTSPFPFPVPTCGDSFHSQRHRSRLHSYAFHQYQVQTALKGSPGFRGHSYFSSVLSSPARWNETQTQSQASLDLSRPSTAASPSVGQSETRDIQVSAE
jgi:hypothetical protein